MNPSAATLFVTGTDTGVGKTRVACALIASARARGVDACGYKPVASGCQPGEHGLRNEDALALQAASGGAEPYGAINPVALELAIAPHLAATAAGVSIDPASLDQGYERLRRQHALIVIEGAGGWEVPLNDETRLADWVAAHQWPVVLVVGLRLGCINHALLSAEAIARRVPLVGWIANCLPPLQPYWQENLTSLQQRIAAPLWGVVHEHASGAEVCRSLDAAPYQRWLARAGTGPSHLRPAQGRVENREPATDAAGSGNRSGAQSDKVGKE